MVGGTCSFPLFLLESLPASLAAKTVTVKVGPSEVVGQEGKEAEECQLAKEVSIEPARLTRESGRKERHRCYSFWSKGTLPPVAAAIPRVHLKLPRGGSRFRMAASLAASGGGLGQGLGRGLGHGLGSAWAGFWTARWAHWACPRLGRGLDRGLGGDQGQ